MVVSVFAIQIVMSFDQYWAIFIVFWFASEVLVVVDDWTFTAFQ